jgi:hypothetical protein
VIYRGSKTRVFLHRDNGYEVTIVDGKVTLTEHSHQDSNGRLRYITLPKPGDNVVFCMTASDRGFKATEWTYASWWKAAERRVHKQPTWRIRQDYLKHGVEHFKILWQGSNIMEMSVKFPRPTSPNGYDSLASSNCTIEHYAQGAWEPVHKDPRKPICCVPHADYLRYCDRPQQRQPRCKHNKMRVA